MLDDELRREILESQKAQESVSKWKVAMIAGLGAAGLGAANIGATVPAAGKTLLFGLWCLIPFVCVYTDTVCYHVGIRILTIARYFRLRQEDENYRNLLFDMDPAQFAATRLFDHYEWYSLRNRRQFRWEPMANILVSILLSGAIGLVGVVGGKSTRLKAAGGEVSPIVGISLIVSGALG